MKDDGKNTKVSAKRMLRAKENFNKLGVISLNIVILIFIRALNIKGSHNKFSFDIAIDTGCVF